jgi:hypothetical protein
MTITGNFEAEGPGDSNSLLVREVCSGGGVAEPARLQQEAVSSGGAAQEQETGWVQLRTPEGRVVGEVRADNPLVFRRVNRGEVVFETNLLDYVLRVRGKSASSTPTPQSDQQEPGS